jgi:hypothetical protein
VNQEQFRYLVSDVQKWIVHTLADYEAKMEPIATAQFERLKEYYPYTLLQRVQRVIVDRCPIPPLTITGIPQLGK